MNMKGFLIGSLVFGAGLAATRYLFAKTVSSKLTSNSASFDAASSDAASYDEVDTYVERRMHGLKIPGASLAIVEGGEIVHLRDFGRARPDGEAPTPQTPFVIGSLTKSFTAMAVKIWPTI